MTFAEIKRKYFRTTEELVSMFLGLVIVIVVGSLIFNYFQREKGTVDIPGSTDITINTDGVEKITGTGERIYKVVKGDSLWKIAVKEYNDGYAWTKIAAVNKLKNASILTVGQEIILPKNQTSTTTLSSEKISIDQGSEYKVVRGDSLWKIAVKAYGDGYQWVNIWKKNQEKLNHPNALEIGMILSIPRLN